MFVCVVYLCLCFLSAVVCVCVGSYIWCVFVVFEFGSNKVGVVSPLIV